ncbi:YecH family protein [Sansalvadorimonas sp. 2012CJ34-2]|uniref:YecH family protein n=1 Tax=Parendozoicomonas callyspongiae TaxID=2942213 RepID=A0ABT0PIE4_9GAMM|nr:YecH family metal-binding protein [Sansalvadorimonas sp. 2012CJ34-2]MCL6271120.1 YecH family protein [Sansalvadorimonas sp. 2012CJ34-2]
MAQSVHGHKVMNMVIESGRSWPRAELLEALAETFGADAEYRTCSVEGFSADQLIDLLLGKGKMVETAEGISVIASKMCNHH